MKKLSIIYMTFLISILQLFPVKAQYKTPANKIFTRQDTLRGSITPERAWWDLTYYHLDIKVNPSDSTIFGTNTVTYRVLQPAGILQIDLQEPLKIIRAVQNNNVLNFRREGNVYWIELAEKQTSRWKIYSLVLTYGGKPKVSIDPPWSGGITWKKDKNGLPFIASSCQGDGASLWWPCKDHMYDEPDSMLISVNVPGNLMDVSNGRLRSIVKQKNRTVNIQLVCGQPNK
jgi:aminopeptidase N